jgi:hypothetical protein
VSVNSYMIQDIANAHNPAPVEREVAYWYQWYFQTERGRAGLAANRRAITKVLWQQWSPNWRFDETTLERTSIAHDNPDFVDVVIHSYRHRYGNAGAIRAMRIFSTGLPRCRRSPCPQSRSTAMPTASFPQPMAARPPRNSLALVPTTSSRAPATICRRRSRRRFPMR